jgi:DNA-binding CsgD family transcriptional regulator/tetratricopeptide (TPR) repeat protein
MELLERSSQLAALNTALDSASAGSGRVVLVSGESGIGKTSLVEQFIGAHQESVRVLWGVCDSLFTPRPLGPVHDMSEQIKGEIPELLASDSNLARLFSTVLIEFKRKPTIAVFEDVHWADEATLDLLRYLGRRIAQTSTLLVMTYRDDELGTRHPLLTVLGDIGNSATCLRVPLSPLSKEAVRSLIQDRPVDLAALYHQTGGNPFYVTEILASKSSANPGGTPAGIPASIRDTVLARTARLSLSGQAVLEVAATIGMRIEPWLLEQAAGSEVDAVEESIAAGILLPSGDALAFRHDLTRQTILEVISPQRKPILHRLVLDALKSSPVASRYLARLAHHAKASGDYQSVVDYAPAAAKQAAAAGAHREAAALYALILRFSEHLSLAEHASTLQDYARECNVTAMQSEAIAAQRKAADVWETLNQPAKQAETLSALAIMLRNHGENEAAEQANQAAVEMMEALPTCAELGIAYRVQATLSFSRREYRAAIDWGERAIEISEAFDDQNNLAMAHVAVGSAWLFIDYERGREYLDRRLQVARESGQERHIANLYAYITSSSVELYYFREAEHYLEEGIAFTSERGLDIFTRYMLAFQELMYIYLGRWDEAGDVSTRLLQNPTHPVISTITALAAAGRLRSRIGDPGGEAVLDEALRMAEQTGTLQYLGYVRTARAEAAWLAGNREGALVEARAAYDLAVSKVHPWFGGELAYWLWKAGESIQPFDWMARPFALQIQGQWQQAAAEWERMRCPYEQARALAEGDIEAKTTALNIFERLGANPAADETRQTLRSSGVVNVPRLRRSSTLQNPFGLTDRQLETLALLIEGLSNAQIAARLHISTKTSGHHVSAILAKLEVNSREAAAELARKHPHFKK